MGSLSCAGGCAEMWMLLGKLAATGSEESSKEENKGEKKKVRKIEETNDKYENVYVTLLGLTFTQIPCRDNFHANIVATTFEAREIVCPKSGLFQSV